MDLKTNLRVLKSNTRHKERLDFMGLPLLKPFHRHSLTQLALSHNSLPAGMAKKFSEYGVSRSVILRLSIEFNYIFVLSKTLDMSIIFIFVNRVNTYIPAY